MRALRAALVAGVLAALVVAAPAGGADECRGLMVCVSVPGPWVVVPTGGGSKRPKVEYQLTCPRGYIVGGLDARLSRRAIDVSFLGRMGSPVNPGISTRRSVVFVGSYVGGDASAPTFKPFIGCMPAVGGGIRIPTAAGAFPPGEPATRHVRTVRVRPGTARVTARCGARERLVDSSFAFAFATRTPPSASLVSSVSGSLRTSGGTVVVTVRGDAEVGSVRALVQVHAVCGSTA